MFLLYSRYILGGSLCWRSHFEVSLHMENCNVWSLESRDWGHSTQYIMPEAERCRVHASGPVEGLGLKVFRFRVQIASKIPQTYNKKCSQRGRMFGTEPLTRILGTTYARTDTNTAIPPPEALDPPYHHIENDASMSSFMFFSMRFSIVWEGYVPA